MHEQQGSHGDHTFRKPDPAKTLVVDPHAAVPEILAPAGGRAQFLAALNSGADAVFLGLQSFNARARATNFSAEDLKELVPVAHAFGMKVLVTVNTLIKQGELDQLFATLAAIEQSGADAVIVQDLAVARIVKQYFPALRLHASTQMAVHNAAGVLEAAQYGFRRVVLARELTHQEIKKIRQAVPREVAELEAFCHGSLCYSYSGLCFFSGAEDARSGNRGECAYTCRKPYKIVSEPGHGFLFSMRDLDTSLSLDLLVNAGVDTLKIEGRKKDAQYVATSVKLYRKSLNRIFGRDTMRENAPDAARAFINDNIPVDIDQQFTFRRQPTNFFLKSRYQENVIDLDNPTHKGLALGTVLSSTKSSVTFRTQHGVELYDGLRVSEMGKVFHSRPQDGDQVTTHVGQTLDRYDNKHTEFSVRSIHVGGRSRTSAGEGDIVTVAIPEQTSAPAKGAQIFKVRSADLKARIERISQLPPDVRLSSYDRIALNLTVSPVDTGGAALEVTCSAGSLKFSIDPILLPAAERPKNPSRFADDLFAAFSVFGESGLAADHVSVGGDLDWFFPKSLLKKVKSAVGEVLRTRLDAEQNQRIARWNHSQHQTTPGTCDTVSNSDTFVIKTDRKETALTALAGDFTPATLSELIFEPKRAFIGNEQAGAVIENLLTACRGKGVVLRIAVPTVVRAWDEPLLSRWFQHAYQIGIRHFEVGNIGAPGLLRKWLGVTDLDLCGDFTLYNLNAASRRALSDLGVKAATISVEDDLENLALHTRALTEDELKQTSVILFKDTPLFIAEACSLTALHNGCPTAAVCGYRTLEIENTEGERFFVAHESCKSVVYGKTAFSITQLKSRLAQLRLRRYRLEFLTRPYNPDEVLRVISAGIAGESVAGTHTANFNRTLL